MQTAGFQIDDDSITAIRKAVEDTITQSEIMTRANCPRKWFYRYALKLRKRGAFNWHFIYGDIMHQMLAKLYSEGLQGTMEKQEPIKAPKVEFPEGVLSTTEDRQEGELLRKIASIIFKNYRIHYQPLDAVLWIRAVEKVFRVEYRGKILEGKIDLVANPNIRDGIFVWDYKTTGTLNLSMLDAWSFRFQFLFYSWLYWRATGDRPDGNYVNGIMKPLLRPKNNKKEGQESEKDYLARIEYDVMANREKYFYRVRMPLPTGMLERFEEEILDPQLDNFLLLTKATKKQRVAIPNVIKAMGMALNTDHCHLYGSFCEYLPLCKDGQMMLPEYEKKEIKHEEL